jgi:putative ABC transport system permease protein
MKIGQLVAKEIFHRKINFSLSLLAALIATAALIGSIILLRIYDLRANTILFQKGNELQSRMDKLQDDTRKSMLKLGYNLVILPKDQNLAEWYSEDTSNTYMPESYADLLAGSKIVYIRHILPSLQQKIHWAERKRSIILTGIRGEVPNLHLDPQKPMQQAVPHGTIALGYELHQSMNIKVNDPIKLMGKVFTVKACNREKGNKDDVTAFISLKDAQELMGKKGQINAILALECLCNENSLATIRKELTSILPGAQVIERESSATARAEARNQVANEAETTIGAENRGRETLGNERERLAATIMPFIILACALWVAVMGFINVRSRREEIGILRTIGVSSRRIFMLFIWKHILIGILGGFFGLILGITVPILLANPGRNVHAIDIAPLPYWFELALLAIIGASLLAVIAGWIPAMIASQQDPAQVLREE